MRCLAPNLLEHLAKIFDGLLQSKVSAPDLLDLTFTRTVLVSQTLYLVVRVLALVIPNFRCFLQPRHRHFFDVAVPSF